MMTPADEIEYTIKEIAAYDKIDVIKSFPEICLLIYESHYIVGITKKYRQNDDVNKRYEELKNEFRNRKITFENKIVDIKRTILFQGNRSASVPIYYKDCVFTDYYNTIIDTNCENCIVEKE